MTLLTRRKRNKTVRKLKRCLWKMFNEIGARWIERERKKGEKRQGERERATESKYTSAKFET